MIKLRILILTNLVVIIVLALLHWFGIKLPFYFAMMLLAVLVAIITKSLRGTFTDGLLVLMFLICAVFLNAHAHK